MAVFFSLALGYLVGSISPAAILAWLNHVDLKQEGTRNLGATNTMIVLGRSAGVFVMVVDIAKSYFAGVLASLLCPSFSAAGLLACAGTILGHCFPLFLHFRGGRGLAAFGGMVLYYQPWFFPVILLPAVILMIVLDAGVAVPVTAGIALPALVYFNGGSGTELLIVVLAGVLLIAKHLDKVKLAWEKKGGDYVRDFFARHVLKKH